MRYYFVFLLVLIPGLVLAQPQYTPMVGIPGVDPNSDFNSYINALYALSISVAALLAVIKIVIAGVRWMLTDIVTSKAQAKKDIQGALIGLLVVLMAVLILTVINPYLVNVNLELNRPELREVPTEPEANQPEDVVIIVNCPQGARGNTTYYDCSPDVCFDRGYVYLGELTDRNQVSCGNFANTEEDN